MSTSAPSLSVITPSYNQGPFIGRTINSVLSQGVGPMEYVVCDGGSGDETVAILRSYGNRLRFVSEPDRGQAHAVNKGIAMTGGDVICWLNSDDTYTPGALQQVQDHFARNPGCQVLYGEANFIDKHDTVVGRYDVAPWDYEKLFDICYLCQPAVFFRREMVTRFGPLDESLQYCMDYELWLRFGSAVAFTHSPEILAQSRIYSDTKTYGARVKVHREIARMFARQYGATPNRWVIAFTYYWLKESRWGRHAAAPKGWPWRQLFYWLAVASFLRWNGKVTSQNIREIERHLFSQAMHPDQVEEGAPE